MNDITDNFASIGALVTEKDQVVTLLGSQPQRYSTLVSALEASVDDVKLDLIQYLTRLCIAWKGKQNKQTLKTSSMLALCRGWTHQVILPQT